MTTLTPAQVAAGTVNPPVYQGFNLKVHPIFDELDDFIAADFAKPEPKVFEIPDDAPELPLFMAGNQLSFLEDLDKQEYTHDNRHEYVDSLEKANLISSKIKGTRKHKVILDLDFDAALLDSSTPGHKHLYLDIDLTEDQMEKFLSVCREVGIIADGNLNQWDRFKAQFLRLPWIKKGEDATSDDDTPKD